MRAALVVCDAQWANGEPVAPSPRQVLQAQLARLAERDPDSEGGPRQ